MQLPGLVETAELSALQVRTAGATRERMLREMAEALEALTAQRGLVLVCEDVHVSDRSTLDLIAYLAQRRGPARLLILGTYRLAEVIVRAHPLRQVVQELHGRQQCQSLSLELLPQAAVGDYLAQRLTPGAVSPSLTAEVYHKTEGNALFLVTVVEYLLQQDLLRKEADEWRVQGRLQHIGVPESVQLLIEKQLEQLSIEEQRVLEAASIVGVEFAAAAVSAGLALDTSRAEAFQAEERCEQLSRHTPFLRVGGSVVWPDGTVTTRYGFRHALYQEVVYERMSPGRRSQLHQRIGERIEGGYGERANEVAAELAVHFERGQDYGRTVRYLRRAGENAVLRSASHEAIQLLTRGLELLKRLPNTPERVQQELALQTTLGPVLLATKGMAAPEAEHAYVRAQELCQQLGETLQIVPILWGLWQIYLARGEYKTALEAAERLLTLAWSVQDSGSLLEAHDAMGTTFTVLGAFAPAREHFEQAITLYDVQHHHSLAALYGGEDPGVICLAFASLPLWMLGYPDQALRKSHEALTLAHELSHPYSLAQAFGFAAWLYQYCREEQAAQEWAEAAITLSTEQGFSWWLALGTALRGWALAAQGQVIEEGIALMRQGLAAHLAIGAKTIRPYLLALLAEACGKAGQAEEGLRLLAEVETEIEKTDERFYEAELWRIKGELTLQQRQVSSVKEPKVQRPKGPFRTPQLEAEACFLKAIEIARQQQAKSLELRATMSLARLWQQQGKRDEARQMLAEIYGWFTEGFDTRDLQEAKALLEELRAMRKKEKGA